MGETHLADLLSFTRDGEWGQGEPGIDLVPMQIIRGTDFERVRFGDLSKLPVRYVREDIAEKKRLRPGDILIETAGGTKDQPTGRTLLISKQLYKRSTHPLCCASFSRFLRPRVDVVNPAYLFWKLQDEYHSGRLLPYHIQHTGVARFQYTQFAYLHVLVLPQIEEQRSAGTLLSLLDDKIELNRRMNETLEAMARAIFKDWFIDFGPTRAKMEGRPPYLAPDLWSLFPDRLDDDGKPEGWSASTIGKEVAAVGGSTPSTEDPTLWDGGISWVTPKDLSGLDSPVLLETRRTLSLSGLAKISSGLLPPGTVLLSSRAPVGYVAISEIPVAINQGFIAMRCTGRLSNMFVWLWTVHNLDTVLENANGSTFQEISKRNFRPIRLLVPSEALLAAFESAVRPLYQRMVIAVYESGELTATRDLLLPKLMSGEIRLRDAEKAVEAAL